MDIKKWMKVVIVMGAGFGMMAGMVGCSLFHQSGTSDESASSGDHSQAVTNDPLVDGLAGTDAVPQAKAEGLPSALPVVPPVEGMEAPHPASSVATQAPAPEMDMSAHPSESTESYSVQAGDTLMIIAYQTCGDAFRWKEIFELNKDHLSNPSLIKKGMILKIPKVDPSVASISKEGQGEKYKIQQGDSLIKISVNVYGTPKKWKKIWQNNKPLIHDPNRVFAGFYLYYILTPQDISEKERYPKVQQAAVASPAQGQRSTGAQFQSQGSQDAQDPQDQAQRADSMNRSQAAQPQAQPSASGVMASVPSLPSLPSAWENSSSRRR